MRNNSNDIYAGIKRGSQSDFRILFDTYFPPLLFYACRFIDKEKAEDIVQDVFVWVWENREKVEMGDRFISFLYESVHHKALNVIERDKMIKTKHAHIEIAEKALEYFSLQNFQPDKGTEDELHEKLLQAIEELPEKGRMCVEMSYMYGMKSKEIANLLKISPRTVETHLYKSLKALREILSILAAVLSI